MSRAAGGEARTFRPSRPLQLGSVVNAFRRGSGDPTSWSDRVGTWVFAWRVPTGPVTLRLVDRPRQGEVEAHAWGEGAPWVLDRLPSAPPGRVRTVDSFPASTALAELVARCDVDRGALFTLAPPPPESLTEVADAGQVMPPKTTFFEPKPAAGIFLRR